MLSVSKVFLSHTSEFAKYPEGKSFIDVAVGEVVRAGALPCDMEYFSARDQQPENYCQEQVRKCDVYIGIVGFRYGSPVRDHPDVSYTELEFDTASENSAKYRLIFLLDEEAKVPTWFTKDYDFGKRQETFRERLLKKSGATCKSFKTIDELEKLLYQALRDYLQPSEPTPKPFTIDWPKGKSPYPGLEWFDQEYAPLFFGREEEVDDIVAKLSEPQGRLLVISGASGSGKSSLIAAGLWKALIQEGRLPGSAAWKWLRFTPSGSESKTPWQALVSAIIHKFPNIRMTSTELSTQWADRSGKNQFTTGLTTEVGFQSTKQETKTDPSPLSGALEPYLSNGQELVLVVDQLEELFIHGFSEKDIQQFLDFLVATTKNPENRIRMITTIRSEFMGKLEESEAVLPLLNQGYNYHLGRVLPRALQAMIEQPAQATGYEFEPHLVETILDEAGNEPGYLPLVAYALKQLFEQRQGRTFTQAALTAMGGVLGAIGTKADQAIKEELIDKKELSEETVNAVFDRFFAELVHFERDGPPTRKRIPLAHFQNDKDALALIQVLSNQDCRVLVTDQERTKKDEKEKDENFKEKMETVEVAHEKLFTSWKQLSKWIEKCGETLRGIAYAEESAQRWHEVGSRIQELWMVDRAEDLQQALSRFHKTPSPMLEQMLRPQAMLEKRLEEKNLSHEERLFIGKRLAEFGDTRPGVRLSENGLPDIAWVEIPGGEIRLELVNHVFTVQPFRLAKYPVTNKQFQAFINDEGYLADEWWEGFEKQKLLPSSWQEPNAPREMVSWYEAVAYCRWLSQQLGAAIRLPTEWEWQQAASGGARYQYPWGQEHDASRCNSADSGLNRTTFVGMYPNGATMQKVLDMSGNVEEWCLNSYENPEKHRSVDYDSSYRRAVRGGAWFSSLFLARTAHRFGFSVDTQIDRLGFRLAKEKP